MDEEVLCNNAKEALIKNNSPDPYDYDEELVEYDEESGED